MSLKSPLVPLAVIVLSFGQLILAGRSATKTVAENLRNPLASTDLRLVDLVQWSPPTARVHELTFARPETGPTYLGDRARLKVQLWSKGRTRLLVIRPVGSEPSRWQAFLDLFSGKGRFEIVADREWVDLGPIPAAGESMTVQVAGLLPGPYGFAELKTPADPIFEVVRIVRPGEETAGTRAFPRYRITVPSPVDANETLARFFFFISISRVLQAGGLLVLVLLFLGWWFLGKDRISSAICCLIPSVVLLHAVCLPPLQGADETSHGATIETLIFRGMPIREADPYPRSWSLAATWLEQDRVQYQPDEPLPLRNPAERARLAARLVQPLKAEATENGSEAPQAGVQGVDTRSPFFFRPFELLGPVLRPITIVDRISAYRLLSALSGLILFCAGALLLHRAGLDPNVVLAYGFVWVVPYMVFTVATISNYAPAIGLGSLLAACAIVLVLSERRREKAVAGVLLVAGSWLGIPIWPDFALLAPIATLVIAFGGFYAATRRLRPWTRRTLLVAFAALLLGAAALFAVTALRTKVGNIGTRMPEEFPKSFDRNAIWMIAAAAAPLALASISALAIRWLSKISPDRARRVLAGVSVTLAVCFLAGFLLTPWTFIPYETDRYWFSKLVREHLKAFVSNSLAWDQDVLSWQFWVGAGGWHDLFLPDAVYALWRWIFIALLVLLPVAAVKWIPETNKAVKGLLLMAGLGASLCVATYTLRYLSPANPWGRFVLPWLSFLLCPIVVLLTRAFARSLGFFIRLLVLLEIWIAVALVGSRYGLGQG
ncbi:MAG: hypothetical protein ACHQPI_10795 [Thermoanaerobaculia bacterium]